MCLMVASRNIALLVGGNVLLSLVYQLSSLKEADFVRCREQIFLSLLGTQCSNV